MRRCRRSGRGRARESRAGTRERLWVRCGDGDDDHDFGCALSAVATYLVELKVRGPLVRCNDFGFGAAGMRSWNYLSLYWGDEAAQPVRRLNDAELATIDRRVSRKEGHDR